MLTRIASLHAALAVAALAAACSSESTVTVDGATLDTGPGVEAGQDTAQPADVAPDTAVADALPADLSPDLPRPPPHWEEVSGGSLIPQLEGHLPVLLDDGRVLIVGGARTITDAPRPSSASTSRAPGSVSA